jgi:co-chaperonin GroES (HSP10)
MTRALCSAATTLLVLLLPTFSAPFPQPKASFGGGNGVGRLVLDEFTGKEGAWNCHYDMVLVERIQGKPKKESGLFIPDEDLPRLHLCRVLSVGSGREEENGSIAPMLDPLKPGDIILAKNPWGIGPKDEETSDGKKLSFMRYQDVAALVTGGLGEE